MLTLLRYYFSINFPSWQIKNKNDYLKISFALFISRLSFDYFFRKDYDVYEYHGNTYNKYDVNRDGVDDRLDLDRNGKIDKYERKNKYSYISHKSDYDYSGPSR